MITQEQLSAMIRNLMRQEFENIAPSPWCFDRDDEMMSMLLAYLEGSTTASEEAHVKSHLLACTRCRYVYGEVRKMVEP